MFPGYLQRYQPPRPLDSVTTSSGTTITVTSSTDLVVASGTSDAVVNLPAAASCAGKVITVIKTGSTNSLVTIDPNSNETINGAATLVLYVQYDMVSIISTGSAWVVISDRIAPHRVRLRRSTAQSIGDAQVIKVLVATSEYDNAGIGDAVTNNQITIKRAGDYRISIGGQTAGSPTIAQIFAQVGGVVVVADSKSVTVGSSMYVGATGTVNLAAGAVVTLHIWQSTGGSANTVTTAGQQPFIELVEVRP